MIDSVSCAAKAMEFSIMSQADVLKAAECQVYLGQYYDTSVKPVPGGLLDPRMVY